MTCFIAHGLVWFDLAMYLAPNEPRVRRGSEGGHLLWFCHGGGTASRYFVKFAPGKVAFRCKIGNA